MYSQANFITFFIFLILQSAFYCEKIRIIHWNDFLGQLQPVKKTSPPDICSVNCIGGIVPLANQIEKESPAEGAFLKINGGNFVAGTNGYVASDPEAWKLYGSLLDDLLTPDVVVLGKSDFQADVSRTVDLLSDRSFSTVLTNLDPSKEPEFSDLANLNIGLYQVENTGFAVVGFADPEITSLSLTGKLVFSPVVEAIKAKLSSGDQNKTIIAVGEGTLALGKTIIESIPQVKLVILSNSYSSIDIGNEYPLKHKNGYIATAGRYGTTLGIMDIETNTAGDITKIDPRLIQVEGDGDDEPIGEFVNATRALRSDIIGTTHVPLDGGAKCWRKECNLGNLVTDAMRHCAYTSENADPSKVYVAVLHSGTLLRDSVQIGESITRLDPHLWLPYHNRVHLTTISGKNLKDMFRITADALNNRGPNWGQFLQISGGLEVTYSNDSSNLFQLTEIKIAAVDTDGALKLKPIKDADIINLVVPTMIYEGRNVFNRANTENWFKSMEDLGFDDECLEQYIVSLGIVYEGFDNRYVFKETTTPPTSDDGGTSTAATVFLTLFICVLVIGLIYLTIAFIIPKLKGEPSKWNPSRWF